MLSDSVIVEDSELGCLYISDGFGGKDTLAGGAYRWRHGCIVRVKETDTIESLTKPYNKWGDTVLGHDYCAGQREELHWSGFQLEAYARRWKL